MRARRVGTLAAVNLLILAAGIAAVELSFGNWLGADRLNRLNLTRNRRRVYDVRKLYESRSGVAVCTRDRYGLRGSFGSPDRIDILTVGGSTTDQRFITDGETWQDVLEGDFRAAGLDVSVANAGVDGQSTYGHVKDFDWWFPGIPGLKPRLVVFYVGLNDFFRDENYAKDDLRKDGGRSLRQTLESDSAIFYLFRTLKGMYSAEIVHDLGHRSIDFSRVRWTSRPMIGGHETVMQPRLDAYAERLRALDARTKELGAVPVFVTQPSRRYKAEGADVLGVEKPFRYGELMINGVDYYIMLKALNEKTLEVCRTNGGIPLDLAYEVSFEDRDFYDFNHMTPTGAAKVGHFLFERLKDRFEGSAREGSVPE